MGSKTRRAKGGKFIYSGSYGCAFYPAIKCKGQKTRKNGYISKISDYNSAVSEKQLSSTVQKMNRNFKYFVYPNEICYPEPNLTDGIKNCKLKLKNPVSLLSPYGGVDLYKIKVPFSDIPALFKGMVNIFDGLLLLHTNYYIHNDVKPLNIVANKMEDSSYNVRLIDFGLTTFITDFVKNPIVESYQYYPFDIRLLSNTYVPNEKDITIFYSAIARSNFPIWMYYNTDGKKIINIRWALSIFKKFVKEDTALARIAFQCDTFSLGRTIYEVYSRLTGHISRGPNNISGSEHLSIKTNVSMPLFSLIRKMCEPDPFTRIGLVAAKAEFVNLLEAFEKHFV